LIGQLVILYLLINFLPSLGRGPVANYLLTYGVQTALWGAMAFYLTRLAHVRPLGKLRLRPLVYFLAVICGVGGILLPALAGLVDGFGNNPASLSPTGLVTNTVFLTATLAGTELSRARLVNSGPWKQATGGVLFLGLFFTLLRLPWVALASLQGHLKTLHFVGGTFLPFLAQNLLACYLALLGGASASLWYQGILTFFPWLSPVLPQLTWALKTLAGLAGPLLGLALVHGTYRSEARETKRGREKYESMAGWVLTGFFSVGLIWFSSGLFYIYPSVIVSGSMTPAIRVGDIVLVERMPASAVRVGDIVQYRRGDLVINHRVIGISGSGDHEVFITKGDANPAPDPPVAAQQIIGKDVFTIPKVGYLSLLLKSLFQKQA